MPPQKFCIFFLLMPAKNKLTSHASKKKVQISTEQIVEEKQQEEFNDYGEDIDDEHEGESFCDAD